MNAPVSGSCDHAELAKLAEAAGNDIWVADEECVEFSHPEARGHPIAVTNPEGIYPVSLGRAFSAFIAAANPATVLALLAEIASLREDRDQWRIWYRKASAEINAQDERASEAERQLANAEGLLKRIAGDDSYDGPSSARLYFGTRVAQ